MKRVVLAMSGGVDSSASAHLLLEQGYDVVGVFMRHHEEEPVCKVPAPLAAGSLSLPVLAPKAHKQGCCSATDADDGRRVADRLGIPFYALNLEDEFGRIIDYFVDEYSAGRTPNPCVQCNNWLKFGKLFDYADQIGAEFVATGHYAQLRAGESGEPELHRGIDGDKDQSYVLFGVDRARLARMLLPVGGYKKPEIRRIAGEVGLRVAEKKDSQEICFVTSGHHGDFVRARRAAGSGSSAGEIVTVDGRVVGEHEGIESYTIGQRRGLGVAMGDRWFVVRIEPELKRVVIGPREALARGELTAKECNWLTAAEPSGSFRCQAQIRYNSAASPATAEILPDRQLRVVFEEPRLGVAPGQAVVLYDESDSRVLGGGWIE